MLRFCYATSLLLAFALPATAQNWSVAAHSGAFVFGDFAKRTLRLSNGDGPGEAGTSTLSAANRAGGALDVEHGFADRWAVRFEVTGTRAPMSIKQGGDDAFTIDAGEIDVATFMLPIVFRINPRGALRFHLMGGPAYAAYHITTGTEAVPIFKGTRTQWGASFGGGVAWQWSSRLAVEGNINDIVTSSPFRTSDFPTSQGLDIPKTHNVHTTLGLRWKF